MPPQDKDAGSNFFENAREWSRLQKRISPHGTFDIINIIPSDVLKVRLVTEGVLVGPSIAIEAYFNEPGTTKVDVEIKEIGGFVYGKEKHLVVHTKRSPESIEELRALEPGKVTKLGEYELSLEEEKKLGKWRSLYHLITNPDAHGLTEEQVFVELGFEKGKIPSAQEILGANLFNLEPNSPEGTYKENYKRLTPAFHPDRVRGRVKQIQNVEEALKKGGCRSEDY